MEQPPIISQVQQRPRILLASFLAPFGALVVPLLLLFIQLASIKEYNRGTDAMMRTAGIIVVIGMPYAYLNIAIGMGITGYCLLRSSRFSFGNLIAVSVSLCGILSLLFTTIVWHDYGHDMLMTLAMTLASTVCGALWWWYIATTRHKAWLIVPAVFIYAAITLSWLHRYDVPPGPIWFGLYCCVPMVMIVVWIWRTHQLRH